MTIKITEQKDVIVVRRWKYSPEKKRSLPTQVYSVSRYKAPSELPDEVIEKHDVDTEEQKTYSDFVSKMKEESEKSSAQVSLSVLIHSLNRAKTALVDPELKDTLTLEEYEALSETVNEIKKLITKNKNTIKRKATRKEKA
ncbi:TPA: hypothetical protein I7732_20945 [Vibrio vulnificus]|nr:hypothetical protein [Vibrio vulnificus]